MKTSALIGVVILTIAWLWLAWMLLSLGGLTLKNIIILAMSAVIVYVPIVKKFSKREN